MTEQARHQGQTSYKSPLKLFWYKKEQNFGDAINPTIVGHVAGRDVKWAGRNNCEMYALGSLMKMVAHDQKSPREEGRKTFIWGTGTMSGISDLAFLKNVRVALLRGPITAALLRRDDREFGDPGLLIADALGERPEQQDVIGVVPHMHFADDPRFVEVAKRNAHIKLIDVRNPDAHAVVREIASCSHVISQSLHGLVTADAYGIPNTWLDPRGLPGAGMLKFHDYAAGVGRALGTPIEASQIEAACTNPSTGELLYVSGVSEAKDALYKSFPDGLRQRGTN